MAVQEPPTQPSVRPQTTCPTCGAPAERGQLVCLECGGRIALAYRRPPSWKLPVAITAIVLLLVGAGGVAAYQAIDDEAQQEIAETPRQDRPGAGPADDGERASGDGEGPAGRDRDDAVPGERPGRDERADGDERPRGGDRSRSEDRGGAAAPDDGRLVRQGPIYSWPRSLEAFTVVLLSAEDRPSATSFARSAGQEGDDRIGVLRSDDFESLPSGFFVVFAGEYETRRAADRAAARLGQRFEGAFPQLVRR